MAAQLPPGLQPLPGRFFNWSLTLPLITGSAGTAEATDKIPEGAGIWVKAVRPTITTGTKQVIASDTARDTILIELKMDSSDLFQNAGFDIFTFQSLIDTMTYQGFKLAPGTQITAKVTHVPLATPAFTLSGAAPLTVKLNFAGYYLKP